MIRLCSVVGAKFDMFSCQVDYAVGSPANIVTTGGGVIVEIRAHPTCSIY